MAKNDFEVIAENTDVCDSEELHDMLVMFGKHLNYCEKRIRQLEAQVKRINSVFPSTRTSKRLRYRIPLKAEE